MIFDGVVELFDLLSAISFWRFLTCFGPAVALALFLFFCTTEKTAAILLSIVPLVVSAIVGTACERAAQRKRARLRSGGR